MKVSLVPNMEKYIGDAEAIIDRHYLPEIGLSGLHVKVYASKVEEANTFKATGDIGPLMNAEFVATGKRPEEIADGILARNAETNAKISGIEEKRLSAKARVRACKSQREIIAILQEIGAPLQ